MSVQRYRGQRNDFLYDKDFFLQTPATPMGASFASDSGDLNNNMSTKYFGKNILLTYFRSGMVLFVICKLLCNITTPTIHMNPSINIT